MSDKKIQYTKDGKEVIVVDTVFFAGQQQYVVELAHDPDGRFLTAVLFDEPLDRRLTGELAELQEKIKAAKTELSVLEKLKKDAGDLKTIVENNTGLRSAALFISGKAEWVVVLRSWYRHNPKEFEKLCTVKSLLEEMSLREVGSYMRLFNFEMDVKKASGDPHRLSVDWECHEVFSIVKQDKNQENYEYYLFAETEEEARTIAQSWHDKEIESILSSKDSMSETRMAMRYDIAQSRFKDYGIVTAPEVMERFRAVSQKVISARIASNNGEIEKIQAKNATLQEELKELTPLESSGSGDGSYQQHGRFTFQGVLPGLTHVLENGTLCYYIIRATVLDYTRPGKEIWGVSTLEVTTTPLKIGTYEECLAYFDTKEETK